MEVKVGVAVGVRVGVDVGVGVEVRVGVGVRVGVDVGGGVDVGVGAVKLALYARLPPPLKPATQMPVGGTGVDGSGGLLGLLQFKNVPPALFGVSATSRIDWPLLTPPNDMPLPCTAQPAGSWQLLGVSPGPLQSVVENVVAWRVKAAVLGEPSTFTFPSPTLVWATLPERAPIAVSMKTMPESSGCA